MFALMRLTTLLTAAILALCAAPALAQSAYTPFDRPHRVIDGRMTAPHMPADRIEYGRKRWEEIQYFAAPDSAPNAANAPLVIILANRGRRSSGYNPLEWLRHRLHEAGYAVAMIPDENDADEPGKMLENYTQALTLLNSRADDLGFDAGRIVIIGYHQGNFAALFGTRPELLQSTGFAFAALHAVIAFDSTDYDIEGRMAQSAYVRGVLRRMFGRDPEEYLAYSPAAHLDSANAPQFLALAHEDSEHVIAASQQFVRRLTAAGAQAQLATYPSPREIRIETFLLFQEGKAGQEVMPFISAALAQ